MLTFILFGIIVIGGAIVGGSWIKECYENICKHEYTD